METLSKQEREDIIKRIVDDITGNISGYSEFIIECVTKELERWGDKDLLDWIK